ncbi:MAG TPA: MarR family transcriptional regulator, partial [Rhodospirillales bacterium]|nr:MarR family transcriptional regulator [Rhodospirillales bacterium]
MTNIVPENIVASADRAEAARCIGFGLRKAVRAVSQVYDGKLEPVGLKGTQFSLLLATSITGQIAVGKLADIMVMDRTTLTRNLRPLKALGYLEMFAGPDKRVRIIQLTKTGR